MVAVRGSSFGGVGLGKDGLLVVQTFNLTVIFEEKLLTRRYFIFQASGIIVRWDAGKWHWLCHQACLGFVE